MHDNEFNFVDHSYLVRHLCINHTFILPPFPPGKKLTIISKATDAAYNVQPDSVNGVWNLRGINNNAWQRVNAEVIVAPVEEDEE